MVYKTSGVCASAISFDIDDAGQDPRCEIPGWMLRKYTGCCPPGRGHGCQRSNQPTGRNPLWFQANFLS